MSTNSHNGLKILVSAVQFRPGTQRNSKNAGENEGAGSSGLSGSSAVSAPTGTPAVQFGPTPPPAVAGDFDWLKAGGL